MTENRNFVVTLNAILREKSILTNKLFLLIIRIHHH